MDKIKKIKKINVEPLVDSDSSDEEESKNEVKLGFLDLNQSSPPPPKSELNIHSLISDNNRLTPENLDELAMRAAGLLREAGGLIGFPNLIRQFCGSVLMVLALAIATTVAAVAVMSMLGVATPAFLVPYLAAIQASSMVSTVLNFVAAKLTLDLNTAAAVTAMATAGTLGLFGKAVQHSGAPTKLNGDMESAAQDLESAAKIWRVPPRFGSRVE